MLNTIGTFAISYVSELVNIIFIYTISCVRECMCMCMFGWADGLERGRYGEETWAQSEKETIHFRPMQVVLLGQSRALSNYRGYISQRNV